MAQWGGAAKATFGLACCFTDRGFGDTGIAVSASSRRDDPGRVTLSGDGLGLRPDPPGSPAGRRPLDDPEPITFTLGASTLVATDTCPMRFRLTCSLKT